MKKLDKLTKKQKALVPVYLKKWLDNGHKVDRIDKKKAEESIAEIYRICGKKAPKHYFHFPSPIQCQLAVNILKNSKDKDFEKF